MFDIVSESLFAFAEAVIAIRSFALFDETAGETLHAAALTEKKHPKMQYPKMQYPKDATSKDVMPIRRKII